MPSKDTKKDYVYAVGRRKTATARVRLYQNTDKPDAHVEVNGQNHTEYFEPTFAKEITDLLDLVTQEKGGHFTVKVEGGGKHSQAQAVCHGIARILVSLNEELRTLLKQKGYLRRDPRMKERKKPGLRRARRAPQWSKR